MSLLFTKVTENASKIKCKFHVFKPPNFKFEKAKRNLELILIAYYASLFSSPVYQRFPKVRISDSEC